MPSTSKKQHNFMAAIAKNPAFAKKVGIKPSVGEHFLTADKGKKFKEGGEMKESKAMVKKEIGFMKKAGAPKSMVKHEMAEAGMKKGGMADCKTVAKKEVKGHEKRMHGMARGGGIEIKGKTKGKMIKMKNGGAC
jgi:hypothetical protein